MATTNWTEKYASIALRREDYDKLMRLLDVYKPPTSRLRLLGWIINEKLQEIKDGQK